MHPTHSREKCIHDRFWGSREFLEHSPSGFLVQQQVLIGRVLVWAWVMVRMCVRACGGACVCVRERERCMYEI